MFDPDVIIRMHDGTAAIQPVVPLTMTSRAKNCTVDDLKWHPILRQALSAKIGISLLEVVQHYLTSDTTYARRKPLRFVTPTIRGHEALTAMLFGILPATYQAAYSELLRSEGYESTELDIQETMHFVGPAVVAPIRMGRHLLHDSRPRIPSIYALDEVSPRDLALCWNIRARYPEMLPVTAEMLELDYSVDILRALLSGHGRIGDLPSINVYVGSEHHPDLRYILDRLALPNISVQYLIPRGRQGGASDWSPDVYVSEDTVGCEAQKDYVPVPVIVPPIERSLGSSTGLRYANEIYMKREKSTSLPADVIPRSILGGVQEHEILMGIAPWRLSAAAIAVFPVFSSLQEVPISPLSPDLVVRAHLRNAGLESTLSPPGMLFNQLADSFLSAPFNIFLSTADGITAFAHLNGKGSIRVDHLIGHLHRTKAYNPRSFVSSLISNGVFVPGLMQQCTRCAADPWFPLQARSHVLICEYCGAELDPDMVRKNERLQLAVRARAPLDRADDRQGVLAVLAVVTWARELSSLRWTLSAGVKVQGRGLDQEIDLFGLARSSSGDNIEEVVFEVKAGPRFEEKDFQRAYALLPVFPNAIYVFATLAKTLSVDQEEAIEKFRLTSLEGLHRGHDVLVLTGSDLIWNSESVDRFGFFIESLRELAKERRQSQNSDDPSAID